MSDRLRQLTSRRLWQALVLVAVVFVTSTGAVPTGLVSSQTGLQDACAAEPSERVALVIDFGTGSDVPEGRRGVFTQCMEVTRGATGLDVLWDHAQESGIRLDIDRSGLICAIDGYPSNNAGCSTGSGGRYRYWSYWTGRSDGWHYQNKGPGFWRVKPGMAEGWRLVEAGKPGEDPGLQGPRNTRHGDQLLRTHVASDICKAVDSAPTTRRPPSTEKPSPVQPGVDANPPGDDSGEVNPGSRVATSSTTQVTTTTIDDDDAGASTTTTSVAGVVSKSSEVAASVDISEIRESPDDAGSGPDIARWAGLVVAAVAVVALLGSGARRSRGRTG